MEVPHHIAIIMDGNGRWARKRGLPRTAGHREGIKRVKEITKEAKRLGVKILTIFAFSTENWSRPKKELSFLFSSLENFLESYKKELIREDIRLVMIGRRDRINPEIIKKIEETERETARNKSFMLVIALDYGGRWDIVEATKKIMRDYENKKFKLEELSEDVVSAYLSLRSIPDPDLLIRTSGEQRMSNFLLWNLAYAEFYFPQVSWPDFKKEELRKALQTFAQRERRFGSL
ncbi:MAG: isoprenyl transferase [Candidatus Omnitrophota bacterium]|nr:MAG: isoprenyl transferase [Candidatus Omnitrophota bacterium]